MWCSVCDSSKDMATIGATSPTVPAAIISRPNAVSSWPLSRKIGITAPRPVVHKASVTIMGACTAGTRWKTPTTAIPSATEMPQPPPPASADAL